MSAPTVYDVAEQAGVSIATVSRVYRSPDSVRAQTRERVLSSARELGYVPSGNARGLASRSTGVLGLCYPDFHDSEADSAPEADPGEVTLYSDEVIRGMERAARRHGYALLIAAAHADDAGTRLAEVASRVDGLAVLAQSMPDEALDMVARRLPVTLLAGHRAQGLDHVQVANFDGLLEVTRHLLTTHRLQRLAFIGGPPDSPDGEARFRGFQAAHLEADLPLPEHPDARGDLTQAAGRKAVEELFGAPGPGPRPQGLVFANDQMAVGALHALDARGISVPGDLAVTGFDGIPLSSLVRPTLTTVRQPMGQLGVAAVELLMARLEQRDRPTEARVLPVSATYRESCGCPPGPAA
ncbi:LacI family DNA-binding transcriptional regulator [Streptomyces sp. NPDC049944]|uniref:LacI family DNA-binding transcriptional regulator n=1 Tax=Streptomyces sp. NPDC049944 TaxID=3155657 RepID=UPI003418AC2F